MGLEQWDWSKIYNRDIHSNYIFCKKKGAIKPPNSFKRVVGYSPLTIISTKYTKSKTFNTPSPLESPLRAPIS